MSRQKKTRKISDLMPARKQDKTDISSTKKGKKPTRYELDNKAWEEKRKKKHKGRPSGSRYANAEKADMIVENVKKDPRVGSRKKIPLIVEEVNQQQNRSAEPIEIVIRPKKECSAEQELFELENNEILNQLLDQLEAGAKLSKKDQEFVDQCLDRIDELMAELGIEPEDDAEQDLYHQFEKININQFK